MFNLKAGTNCTEILWRKGLGSYFKYERDIYLVPDKGRRCFNIVKPMFLCQTLNT